MKGLILRRWALAKLYLSSLVLMEKTNVYERARKVVRELVPLLHTIREHDRSRAALRKKSERL